MPRPTSRRKKRKPSATSEEGARAAVAVADPVPVEVVADAAKAEVAVKNPEGNRPGERSSPEKVHAAGADRAEGKDAGAVEVVAVAVALVAEEIAVRVVATPEQAPSA